MISVAYFPDSYPNVLFLYFKPALRETRVDHKEKISVIYHQDTLIGINLFQVPSALTNELHRGLNRTLTGDFINRLEQHLNTLGLPLKIEPYTSGFITGLLLSKEQHPESDHLFVCSVNIGDKTLQIITNSEKVKVNDKVVIATEDTITATGTMIVPGMMIKQLSEGMFCSAATLGLDKESQGGVMVLPTDTPIGKDYYVIRN
jgi:tRNA-binding EMAP/Myf-like protein